MTRSQTKPTCKCENTGVNEEVIRRQIAEWKKARRKAGLPLTDEPERMRAVGDTYVATIPPPPISGTPDYYRCISKWSAAFQQAQMLDAYRNMITSLQRNETDGAAGLFTLAQAYVDCLQGTPV